MNDININDPAASPFTTNLALTSQYMTKSQARKILFFVDALGEYESEWHDAYDFIDPHPESMRLEDCWTALAVQREDGGPLTVGMPLLSPEPTSSGLSLGTEYGTL